MKDRVQLTGNGDYVTVGSHIGVISAESDEILSPLRESFVTGLSDNDCCVYAASPESVRKLKHLLKSSGVAVAERVEKGDLVFISERDELLKYEVEFEPDHVLSMVGTLFQDKVRAGYDIVRLCTDLSWLVRGTPGRERLIEFETKADETISAPGVPMVSLCQYLGDEISQEEADEILRRHPYILEGEKLRENQEYDVGDPDY